MPRVRTSPEVIATATRDVINFFAIEIGYSTDGDILLSQTKFVYGVTNSNENHETLRQIREEIKWADIPRAAKSDLKALYQKVLVHAEAQGHIGAGSDEGDLP